MSSQASTPKSAGVGEGDLRPQDVEAVFREFLGRTATPGDITQMMQGGSLRAFLDGVLASEEYAQRVAKRDANEGAQADGTFLNCWIEGWEDFARPPGEVSPDGAVIVGEAGHLFIYGGTNDNVATQRGEIEMPADWLDEWRALVTERFAHAQRTERRLACLVVPEKLAVYGDVFPQDLTARRPRPVLRLLDEGELPLAYPAKALRDARKDGETYLLTDSHLTPRGNLILADVTLRALGASPALLADVEHAPSSHLRAGDLGRHFDPPVTEVMTSTAGATEGTVISRATLVSDNWPEISAIGGHIGTIRVFCNDDAPDRRTVVVFGDSYSFGDNAYQGLSWFLAQVFREVHLAWVPFGWDPEYLDSVDADLVVCQTAERFIGRVPRMSVDVRSFAKETIDRHKALTDERIFEDRSPGG